MGIKEDVINKAKEAKAASYKMFSFSTEEKNRALSIIAEEINKNKNEILRQNEIDVENGKKKKLTDAFLAVGIPELDTDIRYATGFTAPDQVVYFYHKRKHYLITSSMEAERAKREVKKGVNVFTPSDLGVLQAKDKKDNYITNSIKALLRKLKINKIFIPPCGGRSFSCKYRARSVSQ